MNLLWWRKPKETDLQVENDEQKPPCPICVQLDRWESYSRSMPRPSSPKPPYRVIGRQTHHVASVDFNMCYEHYDVICAFLLIEGSESVMRRPGRTL